MVIVEHVRGQRRGQRQELSPDARIQFGRHPDCEVAFDPNRDIDASSRHAELKLAADSPRKWILVDLGSSNGTFVDGHRVTERAIEEGVPVLVDFGHNGPRLRLYIGDPKQLPPLALSTRKPLVLAILLLVGVAATVWLGLRAT